MSEDHTYHIFKDGLRVAKYNSELKLLTEETFRSWLTAVNAAAGSTYFVTLDDNPDAIVTVTL